MEVIAEIKECPNCHVDARLMNMIAQEAIKLGNLGENVVPNTMGKIITNVDPRKPPLVGGRVISARVYYDICTNCGKEYIWRIEKGHVTIPARPGIPPKFS